MRAEESARMEIRPLDPQAQLALRRRGDGMLADLAVRRAALSPAVRERPATRKSWLAIAAGLVAIGTGSWLLAGAFSPAPPALPPVAGNDLGGPGEFGHPLTPAIPEPSSALLALAGAVVLLGRRRR